MAINNTQIVTIRGKTSYAKILGDPVPNYSKDGYEWKMDLQITKETAKELKGYGIGDRVKMKPEYLDGQPFVTFKQREMRTDYKTGGQVKNDPPTVLDIAGKPWPQDKLIGNGSDVDVQFTIKDHGPGKKAGVYIRKVRVLNLVPYDNPDALPPIDENDPFYKNLADVDANVPDGPDALNDLLDDDVM